MGTPFVLCHRSHDKATGRKKRAPAVGALFVLSRNGVHRAERECCARPAATNDMRDGILEVETDTEGHHADVAELDRELVFDVGVVDDMFAQAIIMDAKAYMLAEIGACAHLPCEMG